MLLQHGSVRSRDAQCRRGPYLSARVTADIEFSPAAPIAGNVLTFSGSRSVGAVGASVATYRWSLVSGGGIVTGFSSATNASTATATPSGAGSFTVQLQVTDSLGNSNTTTTTVTVAAPPSNNPTPAPPGAGSGGSGGGGGAASGAWVAGVGLAAWLLRRLGRRPLRPRSGRA